MAYQATFKRHEIKYLLTQGQKEAVLAVMEPYMRLDKYGAATIRNIYMDTDDFRVIRRSLEKPEYKEKLRIRSYCRATPEAEVFIELKKKYKGVVYKRRIEMTLAQTRDFFAGKEVPHDNPQIENELKYFLKFYEGIAPAMYLSYDRLAYCGTEDPSLRLTFDTHILYREEQKELDKGIWGKELLPAGMRVMEIKIPNAMPLWLSAILDELEIYPASFSKYGTAYLNEFSEKIHKGKVISCA